jgi:penicillin V acylase-like amidase (Ntn superfamily)
MLYLTMADFGLRDATEPGLHAGLWLQYMLDNAATVSEALALMDGVQIRPAEARGRKARVHLALEDASGDSAVIEPIDGNMVVHHGHDYRVMTNDPTYDEQLALLAKMDFSKPSSTMPLPGNVTPVDRFQRAYYYLNMLPEPPSERAAVASVLAITRNVSVPFGAPYKDFGIYNTEYRRVIDLTARRYFFELTTSPNVIWVDMPKLSAAAGSAVQELNPDSVDLSGNVTDKFKRVDKAPF